MLKNLTNSGASASFRFIAANGEGGNPSSVHCKALTISLSCFFGSSLKYISVQLWSQHIHQPGHITYFWSPFWSLVFGGPLKVCWSLEILTGNKEQPSPVLSGWRPLQDAKCDRRPTRLAAARQPAKRPLTVVLDITRVFPSLSSVLLSTKNF